LSRLNVLIGNASLGTHKFPMTEDNEEMITTNIISLSLLGFFLRPKLRETAMEYDTRTHFTVTAWEGTTIWIWLLAAQLIVKLSSFF
jgi:hypothetical protein